MCRGLVWPLGGRGKLNVWEGVVWPLGGGGKLNVWGSSVAELTCA